MPVLSNLEPKRVFYYFEEISAIPRGSYNMMGIADYCISFAEKHSLKAIRDNSNNIIIFKDAAFGYENAEPVILQGHLDIVCQKTADCKIDFLKDGLELYTDGDFIKARGTTLGADNGIAIAMILAILESDNIPHPPIEAVFTSDEEVGMLGALSLDMSPLKSKKMINLDSEDMDCMTVSCAGGSDFTAKLSLTREDNKGTEITVTLKGLCGGHSGVCIHEGRVNANMLGGRFLNYMNNVSQFEIIEINGGDKGNAIPPVCEIKFSVSNPLDFKSKAEEYLKTVKTEISAREPEFISEISVGEEKESLVISEKDKQNLITALLCAPNGVMEMSAEIEGLVETSLNLGILETEENCITFSFALRSNKASAMKFLEEKLTAFFNLFDAQIKTGGHYPAWEFNSNSALQKIYIDAYTELFGSAPRVEAIHAGLECGVFAGNIPNFDAIAIGPQMYDVHTVNERLSISSTAEIYKLLLKILENCR